MFNRHATETSATEPADRPGHERTSALADAAVPMRACCCPGRPMVKVVMPPPPTATRPRPVDLWLCGHHYRASQTALKSAGARVYPLAASADYAVSARAPAGVSH